MAYKYLCAVCFVILTISGCASTGSVAGDAVDNNASAQSGTVLNISGNDTTGHAAASFGTKDEMKDVQPTNTPVVLE